MIGQQLALLSAWCSLPFSSYLPSRGNVPALGTQNFQLQAGWMKETLTWVLEVRVLIKAAFWKGGDKGDLTSDRLSHATLQGLKPSVCQGVCWALCREKGWRLPLQSP